MNTPTQELTKKTTEELLEESLPQAMTYVDYREMVAQLVLEGKSTGPDQSEALRDYTLLNHNRMRRWDKTLRLSEDTINEISKIDHKRTWVVLTESWCGDAAPSLPVMHKMASLNSNINLKVLLRDENIELMNRFLTNGAMSIPKLIVIDDTTNTILDEWGPRPVEAAEMVKTQKNSPEGLTPEFRETLQSWYNKDKGKSIANELLSSLLLK
ncbi:thioredoxin family protein [uncultured Kriegella sp.]|uniref:thioredoxin family protein n=1 Tax=uncultured Kriegella sp. TaxID=1798910 RepID=UPI0030DBF915|tara:strand:- start:18112 stop:18747 length:636 start_codon:yes stop_codon:yes gene_type:complete